MYELDETAVSPSKVFGGIEECHKELDRIQKKAGVGTCRRTCRETRGKSTGRLLRIREVGRFIIRAYPQPFGTDQIVRNIDCQFSESRVHSTSRRRIEPHDVQSGREEKRSSFAQVQMRYGDGKDGDPVSSPSLICIGSEEHLFLAYRGPGLMCIAVWTNTFSCKLS
jgi:hypothetical protein